MNTQGAAVQSGYGRAIMSSFHAFYSLGGLVGAGTASLMLTFHGSPGPDLIGAGAVVLVALVGILPGLLPTGPEPGGGGGIVLPDRRVALFGILCALVMLTEGAMHDWSGVYMLSVIGAPTSIAALGFAAFAAAMTAGRLLGDWIVRRLGRERALLLSGLMARPACSSCSPHRRRPRHGRLRAHRAGPRQHRADPLLRRRRHPGVPPGVGVAMVATIGYSGFLLGPPLLGITAQATGLVTAFVLLLLPGLVVASAAGRASGRSAGSAEEKHAGVDREGGRGKLPSTDPR